MRNVALSSSSWITLALALSLAGCPSDPGVPANVPLADLPGTIAPVVCDAYEACGSPYVALLFGTGEACAAQLAARFEDGELQRFEDAVTAGTIAYHGDLVDDCVAELGAVGCGFTNPFEVCEAIFEGLVPDGGACEMNEECADSSYCAIAGACPGTCQARLAAGTTCTSDGSCVAGLTCAGGTCRAPAGAGAACEGTTGVSCASSGLFCAGSDGATAGTCTAWSDALSGGVGELCDAQNDDFCDEGLSCAFDGLDGTTPRFRCVARVAAGATCTIAFPDMCPADQTCTGLDLTTFPPDTEGTCAVLPTAGQPCAASIPVPRCAAGLVCLGASGSDPGTCEILARNGGTCTSDQMCASNFCDSGTCAAGDVPACRTGAP